MGFNALGQYSASHKSWDHVGNMLPNVEYSEGVRPAIEFKPAAWLPVQFKDKYYEDWFVVMPGKIVALDNDGRVVPGQYGKVSPPSITYTQDDVDAFVTDVRTGKALKAADLGTFTVASVTDFMGKGKTLKVSKPIGVAPYAYRRWAGGDGSNPANFTEHNYNMQHQVAVLCDYVIEVPLVPAKQAATGLTFNTPSANVSTSNAVSNLPVAKNTTNTPIAFTGGSSSTLFVNEVDAKAKITASGDWYIDLTTGKVSVYATIAPTAINISYYHYASTPSSVSKFASALGDLQPGDFVKCDDNSNYIKATASTGSGSSSGDPFQDIVGQVLDRDSGFPKDLLDRVKTAYNPALNTSATGALPGSLGQLDQMPGSANGGYPDSIYYAGAADTVVRINLISR